MCVHDCVNFVRTGFSVFQPGLMFKKKKRFYWISFCRWRLLWRSGSLLYARLRLSHACTCSWECWTRASSGTCQRRTLAAKCAAKKVRLQQVYGVSCKVLKQHSVKNQSTFAADSQPQNVLKLSTFFISQ